MPTYEYACRACGEHLEVVQSFKDDALTDCPACDRADTLRKVFSAAGIIFKGSGWHIKDYSAAKTAAAGATSDSASTSSDSGSTKDSAGSTKDGAGSTKGSGSSSKEGGSSSGSGSSGSSSTSTPEAKSA